MGIGLLPIVTYNEIEGIIRNFYWGYSTGGRHILISWAHHKKTKAIGRLEFRHATGANENLFFKLWWRLINNPSTLWVQILKVKYFPRCHLPSPKSTDVLASDTEFRTSKSKLLNNIVWTTINGKRTCYFLCSLSLNAATSSPKATRVSIKSRDGWPINSTR